MSAAQPGKQQLVRLPPLQQATPTLEPTLLAAGVDNSKPGSLPKSRLRRVVNAVDLASDQHDANQLSQHIAGSQPAEAGQTCGAGEQPVNPVQVQAAGAQPSDGTLAQTAQAPKIQGSATGASRSVSPAVQPAAGQLSSALPPPTGANKGPMKVMLRYRSPVPSKRKEAHREGPPGVQPAWEEARPRPPSDPSWSCHPSPATSPRGYTAQVVAPSRAPPAREALAGSQPSGKPGKSHSSGRTVSEVLPSKATAANGQPSEVSQLATADIVAALVANSPPCVDNETPDPSPVVPSVEVTHDTALAEASELEDGEIREAAGLSEARQGSVVGAGRGTEGASPAQPSSAHQAAVRYPGPGCGSEARMLHAALMAAAMRLPPPKRPGRQPNPERQLIQANKAQQRLQMYSQRAQQLASMALSFILQVQATRLLGAVSKLCVAACTLHDLQHGCEYAEPLCSAQISTASRRGPRRQVKGKGYAAWQGGEWDQEEQSPERVVAAQERTSQAASEPASAPSQTHSRGRTTSKVRTAKPNCSAARQQSSAAQTASPVSPASHRSRPRKAAAVASMDIELSMDTVDDVEEWRPQRKRRLAAEHSLHPSDDAEEGELARRKAGRNPPQALQAAGPTQTSPELMTGPVPYTGKKRGRPVGSKNTKPSLARSKIAAQEDGARPATPWEVITGVPTLPIPRKGKSANKAAIKRKAQAGGYSPPRRGRRPGSGRGRGRRPKAAGNPSWTLAGAAAAVAEDERGIAAEFWGHPKRSRTMVAQRVLTAQQGASREASEAPEDCLIADHGAEPSDAHVLLLAMNGRQGARQCSPEAAAKEQEERPGGAPMLSSGSDTNNAPQQSASGINLQNLGQLMGANLPSRPPSILVPRGMGHLCSEDAMPPNDADVDDVLRAFNSPGISHEEGAFRRPGSALSQGFSSLQGSKRVPSGKQVWASDAQSEHLSAVSAPLPTLPGLETPHFAVGYGSGASRDGGQLAEARRKRAHDHGASGAPAAPTLASPFAGSSWQDRRPSDSRLNLLYVSDLAQQQTRQPPSQWGNVPQAFVQSSSFPYVQLGQGPPQDSPKARQSVKDWEHLACHNGNMTHPAAGSYGVSSVGFGQAAPFLERRASRLQRPQGYDSFNGAGYQQMDLRQSDSVPDLVASAAAGSPFPGPDGGGSDANRTVRHGYSGLQHPIPLRVPPHQGWRSQHREHHSPSGSPAASSAEQDCRLPGGLPTWRAGLGREASFVRYRREQGQKAVAQNGTGGSYTPMGTNPTSTWDAPANLPQSTAQPPPGNTPGEPSHMPSGARPPTGPHGSGVNERTGAQDDDEAEPDGSRSFPDEDESSDDSELCSPSVEPSRAGGRDASRCASPEREAAAPNARSDADAPDGQPSYPLDGGSEELLALPGFTSLESLNRALLRGGAAGNSTATDACRGGQAQAATVDTANAIADAAASLSRPPVNPPSEAGLSVLEDPGAGQLDDHRDDKATKRSSPSIEPQMPSSPKPTDEVQQNDEPPIVGRSASRAQASRGAAEPGSANAEHVQLRAETPSPAASDEMSAGRNEVLAIASKAASKDDCDSRQPGSHGAGIVDAGQKDSDSAHSAPQPAASYATTMSVHSGQPSGSLGTLDQPGSNTASRADLMREDASSKERPASSQATSRSTGQAEASSPRGAQAAPFVAQSPGMGFVAEVGATDERGLQFKRPRLSLRSSAPLLAQEKDPETSESASKKVKSAPDRMGEPRSSQSEQEIAALNLRAANEQLQARQEAEPAPARHAGRGTSSVAQTVAPDDLPRKSTGFTWKTVDSHKLTQEESTKQWSAAMTHLAEMLYNQLPEGDAKVANASHALQLVLFLKNVAAKEPGLKARVLERFNELLTCTSGAALSQVSLLSSEASTIGELKQQLGQPESRAAIARSQGLVMVRYPGLDLGMMKQEKLALLLNRGANIDIMPASQALGPGGDWVSGEGRIKLSTFQQEGTLLDLAMQKLAAAWKLPLGSAHQRSCFTEALLANLAPWRTLYEPSLDIVATGRIMMQLEDDHASLLQGVEGLPQCSWLGETPESHTEDNMDVDFVVRGPQPAADIESCNPASCSAWSMSSPQWIGPCIRSVVGSTKFAAVPVAAGVSYAQVILSMLFTRTPVHVEDLLLGAVNLLLIGQYKVWYWVPLDRRDIFLEWLRAKYGPMAEAKLFAKQLFLQLTAQEIATLGVRRAIQPPGYMVVTMPGAVFHWTVSLGFSIAEASNFFTDAAGDTFPAVYADWQAYAEQAQAARAEILTANKGRKQQAAAAALTADAKAAKASAGSSGSKCSAGGKGLQSKSANAELKLWKGVFEQRLRLAKNMANTLRAQGVLLEDWEAGEQEY